MMKRDFTFVEDIAEGTVRVLDLIPLGNPAFRTDAPDAGSSYAPYKIYNIGNHEPIELMKFINLLEYEFGREANKNFLPLQLGDVIETYADVEDLKRDINFEPKTTLEIGVGKWAKWFKSHVNNSG